MIHKLIISIIILSITYQIHAYEVDTHAAISREAYKRSILSVQEIYDDLGVENSNVSIGDAYYDYDSKNENRVLRTASYYDNTIIEALDINPFLPIGWVMRGAIREDDCIICSNPKFDGDQGVLLRPLNHFFDPVNNEPLFQKFKTAPQWALGTSSPFTPPITKFKSGNHFTNFDAQTAMIRALSGQYTNNQDEIMYLNAAERKIYWATLFRTLGNMIHLIQDMGQPQHTRSDEHSLINGEERRVYEEYTKVRTLSGKYKYKCLNNNTGPITVEPINYSLLINDVYTDYLIPNFNNYGSYYSTEQKGGNIELGIGLADYSNRGFFTAGTNKDSGSIYPSPENKPLVTRQVDYIDNCLNNSKYTITLLDGEVTDTLDQNKTRTIALTARSLWDLPVKGGMTLPKYTLTQQNYIAMADQLVPRAVAYSAGFINYFFRGRVEVEVANNTGVTAEINIKNISFENNAIGPGEFRIYYDATDGDRKEITINNDTGIVSNSINVNSVHTVEFDVPSDIDYSKPNPIVLVYSGLVGEEQGVIGKVFSMLESSGFIVNPDFPLSDGMYGSRLLTNDNGQWSVSTETGFTAGNIDWKGWYLNGKPTQALTWFGPQARYFPGGGGFDTKIYKGGDIYAVAPGRVLGAALNKDSNGNEWIITIVEYNWGDRVYRRPNKRSTSAALFDPQANHEGWQLIGDIPPINNAEYIDIPWFFNGDGTAAQTMRKVSDNTRRMRLLINISDNSAVMTNLGNIESEGLRTEESTGTVRTVSGNPPPGASELCITGNESISGTYTQISKYNETISENNENIVAVDYRNKAEVLATIKLSNSIVKEYEHVTESEYTYICEAPNRFAVSSGTTRLEYQNDAISNFKYEEVMDIEGEMIVSNRDVQDNIWSSTDINPGSNDRQYKVTYTGSAENYYPRLAFLDLRNKTYVMSIMVERRQASGNTTDSTDPNWITGGWSDEWAFDLHGPGINTHEVIRTNSGAVNKAIGDYPQSHVNAPPYYNTSSGRIPEVDYYYGYEGSWVTDLEGNQFISMERLFGHTFQTYPGYINYLSNGNLNQIFGQDVSNSSFYPVGIR